ncbi:MAG: hypothetical protein ACXWNR_05205, partial [Candidatus Limnocylindrales bacterium]
MSDGPMEGVGAVPLPHSLVWMEGQALDTVEGALHGGAVHTQSLGQLGERRLGLFPAGAGDEPDLVRLLGQAAVCLQGVDRLQMASRGGNGSLQVGRLGIYD